jgi:hypothetical protein
MGSEGWGGPAVAGGTKDPWGDFILVNLVATAPGPLKMVACLPVGKVAGSETSLEGCERVSATMLDSPVMWQIAGAIRR